MSAISRRVAFPRAVGGVFRSPAATSTSQYGRTAAYRRLCTQILEHDATASTYKSVLFPPSLTSRLTSAQASAFTLTPTSRRSISYRDVKKGKDPEAETKPSPRKEQSAKSSPKASASAEAAAEQPKAEEKSSAEEAYEKARAESAKEEQKQEKKEDSTEDGQGAKKEKLPPPPLHGNKTPWQVFTETLQSEFKASKEWNEGTQQLSGSIHDFTQNPNVQKAKSAYSKATETAGTASSAALKSTASAIGSGAAWTWDTSVVKGVRMGVNAVGSGLDKVTKPVRETEAYKNVKEVIDDGSSTRYGGWTEKEERRRRREAKELREVAQGKRPRLENMEEDPKYASRYEHSVLILTF